ncbi:MAG: SDR family NAD(P)-dependent oxidoreductase [Nitrospinae bacterium]|nr:SDR family NAD(P)-dependent oxidoreductase [Nitrospinota bacterium]
MRVLVTGGAGFIGSYIVDELLRRGHMARIFDNIDPQVHPGGKPPAHLNPDAEFILGDVRDRAALKDALEGVDAVFHKAAAVGVAQSQYRVNYFVETNVMGTSNLLDILANEKHKVGKVIVAASMSSYGEGEYRCKNCGFVRPGLRSEKLMAQEDWKNYCTHCGMQVLPIPTREEARQVPNSIYSITKMNQEQMVLNIGKTYGIPAVALRYFNVYGPRQSLNNPYTGVTAIFMSRIKNGNRPVVYEDGQQTRDFISVHDVVEANMLALVSDRANGKTFNIGTGRGTAIKAVAETLARLCGREEIQPSVEKKYRKGDVRHCYANIDHARDLLGFMPKVAFENGMKELIAWADSVEASDRFDVVAKELKEKGLM